MPRSLPAPLAGVLLGAVVSGSAAAQVIVNDDYAFVGTMCVGTSCAGTETFLDHDVQIKSVNPSIRLNDTTTNPSFPDNDWQLNFNDPVPHGANLFSVENISRGTVPFHIAGAARSSSLVVGDRTPLEPSIGIGTLLPQAELHIASQIVPVIRLEQVANDAPTFVPYTWDIQSGQSGLYFVDQNSVTAPLIVGSGAPQNSLRILSEGDIGFGTGAPDTALHLWRDDGHAEMRIEENSAITNPRTLLSLRNNGRPEIVMGNTNTDGEWSFGAGTNFIMKFGTVGSRSPVKTKHLTLYSGSGDLEITGQIITGGPTCKAGCDAVFSEDYDLPSISEHAEAMFALGHLPNIGPTGPGLKLNLTDRMGQLLNELEHAHIYIAHLEAEVRRLPELEARLARLEQALSKSALAAP